MSDRIYLDPSEVAGSRTTIELTDWISADGGVDWGDAAVLNSISEQAVGSSVSDFRIPNRPISIPLRLRAVGGTTFATIRSTLQTKVGLWQGQGGWLKRVTSGGTVFCDVVSAQLHLGGDWMQANRDADLQAVLSLEAIPDFYEAEETLSDHTETTAPEIRFTETTANGGDFPLGDRVRIVVDDDSAQNQRGLFWAWRGKHYSSAVTAASAYDAESLSPLDTAAVAAKGGAASGQVVTHSSLSTNWTPVVGTNIGGGTATAGTALTNTGTNRIYARVFSTSGTTVQARFVYDVGDLVLPTENDAVRLYDGGTFHILDLGEVRLDPPPTGTHRWQGMIQAKGDAGAESFSVDRVWIANQDESAGVLRAPLTIPLGLSTYSARSGFDTESGAIAGDALAIGGTWTGAGDADDFTVSNGIATRTLTNDSAGSIAMGRVITASTPTLTNTVVQCDVKWSAQDALGTGPYLALIARYTDINNFLFGYLTPGTTPGLTQLVMARYVASSVTGITSPLLNRVLSVDTFYTLILYVSASGETWFAICPQGTTTPIASTTAVDSVLATGGALASGKVGIADRLANGVANTRTYDNFAAWVPSPDAVCFASQSLELATAGITREDSGGTAYGPVSVQYGDIPRMPNRSSAGTVEFMGKFSRGDLQTINDPNIDDVSTRVYRRASHLLLPG